MLSLGLFFCGSHLEGKMAAANMDIEENGVSMVSRQGTGRSYSTVHYYIMHHLTPFYLVIVHYHHK